MSIVPLLDDASLLVWIFGKLITNSSCNKCWPAELVPEGTVDKRACDLREPSATPATVKLFQTTRFVGGHFCFYQ